MESILQSSLFGQDFVKYRKNTPITVRRVFSNSVKTKGIDELPIVIDSVDPQLSNLLAGPEQKRYNRNGKEFHFHTDLNINEIILEIKTRIKIEGVNTKILKLGLENGKILDENEVLGNIYKKFKNQTDDILYLILTQETTIYGYLLSLVKYIFGENFMKILTT